MATNTDLEFIGEVQEILPARKYIIRLADPMMNGAIVEGTLSGKMKLNKISVMEGDYVKVELSEYEMSKGRIIYRYKSPQEAHRAMEGQDQNTEEVTK